MSKRFYTKEHEWADITEGQAVVGITDYAQSQLGDIVFVDLPEVGSKVSQGDSLCVVESTKAASDVYAPISGVVEAVNTALSDTPELINTSADGEGWMIKLKEIDQSQIETLMDKDSYQKLVDQS